MKILNQTQYEYLIKKVQNLVKKAQSFEKEAQSFKKQALKFSLISIGVVLLLYFLFPPVGIVIGGIFLIVAIERSLKALKKDTKAKERYTLAQNYLRGIEGEKAVVNILQELDNSWWLINNIRLRKQHGNIDHILLSPKGIFLIETKHYGGSVRCYGDDWIMLGKRRGRRKSTRYIIKSASKQVRFQASLLHGLLKRKLKLDVPIIPICVFTDPEVKLQVRRPSVKILKLKDLVEWLQKTRPKYHLTDKEMNLISQCILEKTKNLSFGESAVSEKIQS